MTTRYVLRFALLVLSLVLVAPPAHAVGGIGDLYVTSDASNLTRGDSGATGSFLGVHLTSVAPASGQLAIHFGDVNGRVLVGHFSGGVNEFDATTGAFIKTYNPGGGWMWSALYRPNGNVLATLSSVDKVVEFDGTTGAVIGVFANLPALTLPSDMRYGPNGNLYVKMRVAAHPIFTRSGKTVMSQIGVNVAQAALGDELEVETLDGAVDFRLPPGTQSGQQFRVRGKGVPDLRGGDRGDQIVTVQVLVPKQLSPEQRDLFQQLSETLGSEITTAPGHRSFFDKVKDALGV